MANEPEILAAIPKSQNAEIRITRTTYKNSPMIDVRVWAIPSGGTEYVRTRKGFTVAERNFPKFIQSIRSIEI